MKKNMITSQYQLDLISAMSKLNIFKVYGFATHYDELNCITFYSVVWEEDGSLTEIP